MDFNYLSHFITVLQEYDFKFGVVYIDDKNEFLFRITTFQSEHEFVRYDNIKKHKVFYLDKYITLKQLLKRLIKIRKDLMIRYSDDV